MKDAQGGWEDELISRIAAEIRRLRTSQNMSAQALADRVADLGLTMSRSTLADIENGRRKFITVAELLAIANVLNAAPIMLIFPGPYEGPEVVEAVPGLQGHKSEVIKWFCGETLNDRLVSNVVAYAENLRPLREAREIEQLEQERHSIERDLRLFVQEGNNDQVELYAQLLLNVRRKIDQFGKKNEG